MKNLKKYLFSILLTFYFLQCFPQAITVDTNTYTVPELVTEVLINKVCVPVSNITWKTGNTNGFDSTNGIGYFKNTNPSFPLKSGVILSTGNVLNSPGPNTSVLNGGNAAWTGDKDLEATLLKAGIKIKSANATVLEFDFVPFSANFNFQFLFASEEYGTYQCKFSDAFAFLLTNKTTGETTNLAVVPNTTTPISVVTIRDFLYNSYCPSVNSKYFGTFNGGSNAAGSATNFNGQTVLMDATSSTLIPNTPYHIKLVIADRQDYQADSAIFLGANTFNIGQNVLGADLTIANKTALCLNTSQTLLSGLDPKEYSFVWTYNGNPIGGDTPNLNINKAGIYSLTYTIKSTSCKVNTDYLTVEYYKEIITPDPIDLYKCSSGAPTLTFDLSYNTPIVSIPGTKVSYHRSSGDADSASNPLSTTFTMVSGIFPLTIWIRIEDVVTHCFITKSFLLESAPPAMQNSPIDINLCETPTAAGKAYFDLEQQTSNILGSQSSVLFSVTYYSTKKEALENKNPLVDIANYLSGNATVYARTQNKTDPNCYSVTDINLKIVPKPTIDLITDQFVCKSFVLPILKNQGNYYSGPNKGLPMLNAGDEIKTIKTIYIYKESSGVPSCPAEVSFKVYIVKPETISQNPVNVCDTYTVPVSPYGARYFTLPGGPAAGGTELIGGKSVISKEGLNVLYTYFVSNDPNPCIFESDIYVTITITPKITGDFKNVFECTSYTLPPLKVGNYYTLDSVTGIYTLANPTITTTTKLYVFATNDFCRTEDIVFTVYIKTLGINDVNACLNYDLPPAPVGEYRTAPKGGGNKILPGIIDKSMIVYTYVAGAGIPNCTDDLSFTITLNAPFLATPKGVTSCESFLLPTNSEDAEYYTLPGGPATPKNIKLLPNFLITNTSKIYIYKPSTTLAGCYNEKPWIITINKRPLIDSRASIVQCDPYVLTALTKGNYFDDPNGKNPLPAGTVIANDNRIYIYAENANDSSCFAENFFDISIRGVKTDPIPSQLTYCDSFTFPVLPTPNNFYYDAPDGPDGDGQIIPFGTVITSATLKPIYYIYTETANRLNCSDEKSFSIKIVDKPVANPVKTLEVCDTFGKNDGITKFDLTEIAIRNQVLKGQTPDSNFTLTFYTSLSNANSTSAKPIANPASYLNSNPLSDSVYIRVSNNTLASSCFDVVELKMIVNKLADINLKSEYYICEDFETGTLLNKATLNTEIADPNFSFKWTLDEIPFGGNTSSITTTQIGTYKVEVTNSLTGCTNSLSSRVIKYAPHLEIVSTDAFDNPFSISVKVVGAGSGNYQYQIDNLPFQDSSSFNDVVPGQHLISVKDMNGHCNPKPLEVTIINYPKFFTPNGDGYNDYWNIPHLALSNPNAKINIFDRYGKLIIQITPTTAGWNGTLNNLALPASDYWFTVDYIEKGISKTFKSHFSLKR